MCNARSLFSTSPHKCCGSRTLCANVYRRTSTTSGSVARQFTCRRIFASYVQFADRRSTKLSLNLPARILQQHLAMLPVHRHSNPYARRFASFRPHIVLLGMLIVGLFVFWPSAPRSTITLEGPPAGAEEQQTVVADKAADRAAEKPAEKVLVELFVMSQCPDAKFCEKEFSGILDTVPSVMTIRTEHIAYLLEDDKKVSCPHGDGECLGNKHQLCLGAHVPADKNKEWFVATLLCMNGGNIPDVKNLEACMTTAGIAKDVQDKVLACSTGDEGTQLQIKSAKEVKSRQVVRSCTVYVDGKRRCIRDGGRWYDCPGGDSREAFLQTICDAHKAKAGNVVPECAAALPPTAAKTGARLLL